MSHKRKPSKTLMNLYRHEYLTTEITKEDLQKKYNLPDFEELHAWEKPAAETSPQSVVAEVVPTKPKEPQPKAPQSVVAEVVHTKPVVAYTEPPPEDQNEKTLKDKIEEFKLNIVDFSLDFSVNELNTAPLKDIKELAAVIAGIEASYKKTDVPQLNVNILVNNILQEYVDDV